MSNICYNCLRAKAKDAESLIKLIDWINSKNSDPDKDFFETVLPLDEKFTSEGIVPEGYGDEYIYKYYTWGCTDMYDSYVRIDYLAGSKMADIRFHTEWHPADGIAIKISETFPELLFEFYWAEPARGLWGRAIFENGELKSDNYGKDGIETFDFEQMLITLIAIGYLDWFDTREEEKDIIYKIQAEITDAYSFRLQICHWDKETELETIVVERFSFPFADGEYERDWENLKLAYAEKAKKFGW